MNRCTALGDKPELQQSSCCGVQQNFQRADRGLETDGLLSVEDTKDAFYSIKRLFKDILPVLTALLPGVGH